MGRVELFPTADNTLDAPEMLLPGFILVLDSIDTAIVCICASQATGRVVGRPIYPLAWLNCFIFGQPISRGHPTPDVTNRRGIDVGETYCDEVAICCQIHCRTKIQRARYHGVDILRQGRIRHCKATSRRTCMAGATSRGYCY